MASLLRPGTALLIAGPAGCGKSTLARLIAEQVGEKVHTCSVWDLRQRFGGPFADEPGVLIIDEMPVTVASLNEIKALAKNNFIEVLQLGENPRAVPMPRSIVIMTVPSNGCLTLQPIGGVA